MDPHSFINEKPLGLVLQAVFTKKNQSFFQDNESLKNKLT